MYLPRRPLTFRLRPLALAMALLPVANPVLAEDTRLGPVLVEGQAEAAASLGTATVETETIQFAFGNFF